MIIINKNEGVCIDNNGTYEFSCRCNGGFQGDRCDYDLCTETECFNGGKCIAVSINESNVEAQCSCINGFTGYLCQEHMCEKLECLNGSNCTVAHSDFTDFNARCDCLYGFDGELCEIDLCDGIECYNGGICSIDESNPHNLKGNCNCTDQFVGESCTIVTGCEGYPCQNDGRCKLLPEADTTVQECFNRSKHFKNYVIWYLMVYLIDIVIEEDKFRDW